MKNFELTLDKILENNPVMTVSQGDFNVKSNYWCKADITFVEGSKVILQPVTMASLSSCIDLIFISQPNLAMESGILLLLYSNCHHHIVFAKFNLSIFYPPPYERTVWYYERANTELIIRAINQFELLIN